MSFALTANFVGDTYKLVNLRFRFRLNKWILSTKVVTQIVEKRYRFVFNIGGSITIMLFFNHLGIIQYL